ncbi:hypothetical protein LTR28_001664 [Elasticomyces elasticus]|nr:hypothetical protein LTR28_001664 [Elasticomyces elasticus]
MTQAAIIGGGFAGMTMAFFLKKHGISSAIDEARDKNYTSGGNIALAPNALRVLDHAGVYDCVRTKGFNYEEITFANGSGSVLGVFLNGSQKEYNFQALRVHRTIICDVLRAELERQDVLVVYSKRFATIRIGMRSDYASTNGDPKEDDDLTSQHTRANSIFMDDEVIKAHEGDNEHVANHFANQLSRMKSIESADQFQDEIEAQLDGA